MENSATSENPTHILSQ